jgi:hypothetical protein
MLSRQRRALRVLAWFSWGGVVLSIPFALVAASLFDRASQGLFSPAGLFGILAFAVGIAWAVFFYQRVLQPGQTRNGVLRRLNQATLTGAYPSYLGVAVALLFSNAMVIVPFAAVASINVTLLGSLGRRVVDTQQGHSP